MKLKIWKSLKWSVTPLVIISLLLSMGVTAGASENDIFENNTTSPEGSLFVPGEILVKFKRGVPESVIDKINTGNSAFILQRSRWGHMRIGIPKGKAISDMVQVYSRNPNVEYAQPNSICQAVMSPNDPFYSLQWHLDNPEYGGINMESAWNLSAGTGVAVAVLDTGVAYENYDDDGDGNYDYWLAP